ncbi:MAG: phosphoglycerate mutase family protein [Caldilineaceae bacterium]
MQLFLIRHGESANNALGVGDISYEDYMAQRSPDPGLTQIGKRQAEMVARHLAADGHPESRNGTPLASTAPATASRRCTSARCCVPCRRLGPSPPRSGWTRRSWSTSMNTAASSWATRAAKPIPCAPTPG